jgi:hypothetical protein
MIFEGENKKSEDQRTREYGFENFPSFFPDTDPSPITVKADQIK